MRFWVYGEDLIYFCSSESEEEEEQEERTEGGGGQQREQENTSPNTAPEVNRSSEGSPQPRDTQLPCCQSDPGDCKPRIVCGHSQDTAGTPSDLSAIETQHNPPDAYETKTTVDDSQYRWHLAARTRILSRNSSEMWTLLL